ncbi:MAG: hypothetical protein WD795_02650 [Woeseia sp.]
MELRIFRAPSIQVSTYFRLLSLLLRGFAAPLRIACILFLHCAGIFLELLSDRFEFGNYDFCYHVCIEETCSEHTDEYCEGDAQVVGEFVPSRHRKHSFAPYYERIDFIVVPPLSIILLLLCIRSALFLLVSMPVAVCWGLSRGRLALTLATGHFTAVGLSGLIQATIFPAVVRWTHGVEILATSVCYGLALAWLLFAPSRTPAAGCVDERQAAES